METGLKQEREEWRHEINIGTRYPWLLVDYKKNRESEMWRASRMVEELCEYALVLERKLEENK